MGSSRHKARAAVTSPKKAPWTEWRPGLLLAKTIGERRKTQLHLWIWGEEGAEEDDHQRGGQDRGTIRAF